jgi:hypothetical protein
MSEEKPEGRVGRKDIVSGSLTQGMRQTLHVETVWLRLRKELSPVLVPAGARRWPMAKKSKGRNAANASAAITLQHMIADAFGDKSIELRRDGQAPLAFDGRRLIEVTSYTTGPSLWYELAVYQRDNDYVLATHIYKKRAEEKDIHKAEVFSSLSALCVAVENCDAAHDVTFVSDLTDARLSTAEAMIRAAALRQKIDEARAEYRAAAGDLLTELSRLMG